MKIQRE